MPLIYGFILDLIFGDPYFMPHPIRLIGLVINKTEKFLRIFFKSNKSLFFAGIILNIFVLSISFIVPTIILKIAANISLKLSFFIEVFFIYQIIATKSLKTESMKVYKSLKENDILNARKYLSYIVGRDTENLNEEKIIKATVETVAENTVDGVIAVIFYICIGGAPLGFLYKAINTLDSMVGYKNENYFYLGKFSAKVDDIANYVPARISAIIMIFSSFVLGHDYKNAWKIYKRDRYNHSSPNSAQTEAVCAGALQIELGGTAVYFSKEVVKPTIGTELRKPEIEDIKKTNNLLYLTAMIAVLISTILDSLVWS